MATEFVVTSPASSGLGAFKAHYATVQAALRAASMVIDEGAPLVWIVDGEGKTILRDDQIKLLNRRIAQNSEAREYLFLQLNKFQADAEHNDGNESAGHHNDANLQWIRQIEVLFAERENF